MGVPCITFHNTTERPENITVGKNEFVGMNSSANKPVLDRLFSSK
jgi:UDP-N-acetylglucosamine 2-epimerase